MDWKDVIEFGRLYGEEFERSQVEKWLRGQNSSKAVRVVLAVMNERLSARERVPVRPESLLARPFEGVPAARPAEEVRSVEVVPEEVVAEEEVAEEEEVEVVEMSESGYADGSGRWLWDARLRTTGVLWDDTMWVYKGRLEVGSVVRCGGDVLVLKSGGVCGLRG